MKRIVMMMLAMTIGFVAASAQSAKDIYTQAKALYDAKDYAKAVPLLRKAAAAGNKKAQYRLGRCYDKGHGVTKDKKEAFRYFSKSAAQGYAKAEYRMARAYVNGKVVTADEKKARTFMKRAAGSKKHGEEIMKELREDAAKGDNTSKKLLEMVK